MSEDVVLCLLLMLRRLMVLFTLWILLRLAVSERSPRGGVATAEVVGDTSVGRV